MKRKIFEQEQIAGAVDLGLGASSPDEIELVPVDEKSKEDRNRIREILKKG